jgi:hypothetical protein
VWLECEKLVFRGLATAGGFSFYAPDKIMNYKATPPSARYAFTFWAFPFDQFADNLKAYVEFADNHFKRTGFRCNMPLGSYFIKKDSSSLLSYTNGGDVMSIDPIHAYRAEDEEEWFCFLREFNAWSFDRGGVPLINQSPFVDREHVLAAYGSRWPQMADWLEEADPEGRMRNEFFASLLGDE